MKKLIIAIVVLGAIGGGVYALRNFRLSNQFLDGEQEEVKRGDLVIPVTANGMVEPEQFVQIKSKASGQVKKIHVIPGQMVRAGDVLVELDPVDETRIVEARQADLDRAKSAHEKAKITQENLEKDLPLQTALAKARLDDAKARQDEAKYHWERIQELYKQKNANEVEVAMRKAAHITADAQVKLLETELKRAENNEKIMIRSAMEDVAQAEAAKRTAEKALDEAKLRLAETTVRAQSDGMVYNIVIREGEMIQSGTQSLTGGTPLMILANTSAMFVMAQVDEADIGAIRAIAPEYAKPGKTKPLDRAEYLRIANEVIQKAGVEADASKVADQTEQADTLLRGRPVEVEVEAYRGEAYRGVIERIEPEPQNVNNVITFKVRIRLLGEDLEKLLGLQADLAFTTEKIRDAVLVKNDALYSEGKDCFVYTPKPAGGGLWDEEKVAVKIGKTDGTFTQIVKGISPGDKVFTKRPKRTAKEKESQSK